jgi:D-amino-acid dehydrogenase
MDPQRFLGEMRRRIKEQGGDVRHGVEVSGIEDGMAVLTDGERVEGGAFVVAGGAWSPGLARSVGVQLPMQAGKGYSLTMTSPPQTPRTCSILGEAKVAVTPMGKQLRFGGTMEIGGNSLEVSPRRVRGIVKSACRVLPQFSPEDFEGIEPWAGLRPCSPDGLPYLGRGPGEKNVVVATGHSMMGLSLGPVTGKIVAQLVCGEETSVDVGPLELDRF